MWDYDLRSSIGQSVGNSLERNSVPSDSSTPKIGGDHFCLMSTRKAKGHPSLLISATIHGWAFERILL